MCFATIWEAYHLGGMQIACCFKCISHVNFGLRVEQLERVTTSSSYRNCPEAIAALSTVMTSTIAHTAAAYFSVMVLSPASKLLFVCNIFAYCFN
jgi:hypothetical protein